MTQATVPARLYAVDETKEPQVPRQSLVTFFSRFLRAGGTVSILEWRSLLDAEQRDAAEAAGEIVWRERALMIAECMRDVPKSEDKERAVDEALLRAVTP